MSVYDVRRQQSIDRALEGAPPTVPPGNGPRAGAQAAGRLSANRGLQRRSDPGAAAASSCRRVKRRRVARCGPAIRRNLAVLAPGEQQATERRVLAVLRKCAPDHRLVARTRERDVGEPELLAALSSMC